jgi:dolichol kinase
LAKYQPWAYPGLSNGVILRKTIHTSGFAVPLLCIRLSSTYMVSLPLVLLTIVYTVAELARTKGIKVPVFSTITRKAAAPKPEINHFVTAPITFATGIIISLLIFPTQIAYTSIAILTLGDSFASVFGRTFGKTSLFFNRKKSLEGTICGFTFAFLGSLFFIGPIQAIVACAVGMFAECLPSPFDDNLVTPLVAGTVLILLTLF